MGRVARFFVADPGEVRRVQLPPDESRHARRVLRLREGAEVVLFDGTNREHRGRIAAYEEGRAVVEIEMTTVVDREPAVAVTVAAAVPKGQRMEDLVRACAELGAARIVPLETARTVVRERAGRTRRMERLRRASLEASKQCGRNRVTAVDESTGLEAVLATAADHDRALIASTGPEVRTITDAMEGAVTGSRILFVVGPEGGFSAEELVAARAAGCVPVTLGRSVLRVATAAVAGLAMVVASAG